MAQSISERREILLPELERSQRELRRAVDELQTAVQRGLDVRRWIADRPLPWLVGGLLVGLWLGRR